jgi:hypothetical protein
MSEDKSARRLDGSELAPSQPNTSQDASAEGSLSAIAKHTRKEEARLVRKLDWNLMTLFFVLCELSRPLYEFAV